MPLDSFVSRHAEIVSSEHGQHAVCACLFGAAIGMSGGMTDGGAGETAARAAGRPVLETAMGAAAVATFGTGRAM